MEPKDFIMMPVPANRFTDVCALLGSASLAALAAGNVGLTARDMGQPQRVVQPGDNAQPDTAQSSVGSEISAPANQESAGTGPDATSDASPSDGVDAHGHPWSAELHASTKGKTKDGLWRMKVGVSRPAPLPGFPVDNGGQSAATGTSSDATTASATSQTVTAPESAPAATSGPEEDDEFAAFRAAAATSNAVDEAAAASVPARQYSDADLSALCNQAAVKLGDPNPVKEIIAKFTPAGEVAHSRSIPDHLRTEFVKAVEEKAGIQFAG